MTRPMTPASSAATPTGTARWGWRLLITVSAVLVLNGVGLYLVIVDTHTERTIGVLVTAVGALTMAATLEGLRSGSVLATRVAWVLVATLAALGLHSLRGDRLDIPAFYVGLAVIAALGTMLTRRGKAER